jgi:putative autoinducer-2 (AI-2) aldolase
MGRNIWQNDYPVAMIKALRAIIHKKASVQEANDIFEQEKSKKSKE